MHGPKSLREKLTAWDAKNDPKASLTDRQKDSFMELTTHSANRPLPVEVIMLTSVLWIEPLLCLSLTTTQLSLFCYQSAPLVTFVDIHKCPLLIIVNLCQAFIAWDELQQKPFRLKRNSHDHSYIHTQGHLYDFSEGTTDLLGYAGANKFLSKFYLLLGDLPLFFKIKIKNIVMSSITSNHFYLCT